MQKEVYVNRAAIEELKRNINNSDIVKEDDVIWQLERHLDRHELETVLHDEHISFKALEIDLLIEINNS
ncbi:unnamed protein product [Adineta ricciae]|uniref:Uncharacterized protein n=1 Tax=Adineta ricciae TaxID=249248 RepID=A0A814EEL2_ADIRI|nr:unnamed protein product [Adineta ricciae]CAF0966931.1 unnamed protein product [Adineta ricciae]